MISCDECQRKLVALFDNEAGKDDEILTDVHLKACSDCRAFREDLVKLRQQFTSVAVPGIPSSVQQEVMQLTQADSRRGDNRRNDAGPLHLPLFVRFPRLAWAGGLAALFLVAASWIVSLSLARKVETLKQQLETSRREIALAHEKARLKEAQDRQQKAISALYFRMQELEQRVERSGPPGLVSFPTEHNGL